MWRFIQSFFLMATQKAEVRDDALSDGESDIPLRHARIHFVSVSRDHEALTADANTKETDVALITTLRMQHRSDGLE